MILRNLPKITRIGGGASPLESPEISLDNYGAAVFLFENTEGNTLTVKIKANIADGNPESVPFLFREASKCGYENIESDGKTLTDGGVFVAVITADMLAHCEYDRVSVELASDGDLSTVYALLIQPRYENNE